MKTHSHDHFINVASFDNAANAESLKAYLIQQGLEARVQDETHLQRFWFAANPKAGIHVQVSRPSFEQSQLILKQTEALPYIQNAIRCPSCKSLRVQYPDLTRKNILPTLLAQLFVLLRMTKHKYYCEDCHYSWVRTPLPTVFGKEPGMKPSTVTGLK